MKKVSEILNKNVNKSAPYISKRLNKMCMNWAIEAHKIDSSKPVSYYFTLFLKRIRSVRFREVFGNDHPIST